jgi:hypothetical protein
MISIKLKLFNWKKLLKLKIIKLNYFKIISKLSKLNKNIITKIKTILSINSKYKYYVEKLHNINPVITKNTYKNIIK